jgi:hypothetical protein
MLRRVLSAAVVLALFAGAAPAADDKAEGELPDKSKQIRGKVKKIDTEKGVFVVTTKKDDKDADVDIKVDDDTTFMMPSPNPKAGAVTGKDGLKALKVGMAVQIITLGKKKNVLAMGGLTGRLGPQIGALGKIKKLDADKGVLILTVKGKDEDKDQEIKLTEDVKVMIFTPKARTLDGAAALKEKDLFKPGTTINVMKSPSGSTMLIIGGFPTSPMGTNPAARTSGKIKKVDAEKGIWVVSAGGKELETDANTKFMVFGARAKPLSAKEAAKRDEFKEGATVHLFTNPEGKITMVMAGAPAVKSDGVKKPKTDE